MQDEDNFKHFIDLGCENNIHYFAKSIHSAIQIM